jgi:hypothetical protein
MSYFSSKHAALRSKSKDWLARNQNNVSEWSDMSTRELLFQWGSTIKINSACWSSTKRTSSSSHNVVFNSNRFNYIQFQIVLHCQLVLQMAWWEPCRFVSVIVIVFFLWGCGIMMTVCIWFTLIIVLIISHLWVMKIRRCFYQLEVNM